MAWALEWKVAVRTWAREAELARESERPRRSRRERPDVRNHPDIRVLAFSTKARPKQTTLNSWADPSI